MVWNMGNWAMKALYSSTYEKMNLFKKGSMFVCHEENQHWFLLWKCPPLPFPTHQEGPSEWQHQGSMPCVFWGTRLLWSLHMIMKRRLFLWKHPGGENRPIHLSWVLVLKRKTCNRGAQQIWAVINFMFKRE